MVLRTNSKLSPESPNMLRQEYSKYTSMENKLGMLSHPNRAAVAVEEVFKPLVQILRLFGHCPLTYRKTDNFGPPGTDENCMPELGVYEYRWQSPWNLWIATCLVLYSGMWAIFAAEGITDFRLYNKGGLALSLQQCL